VNALHALERLERTIGRAVRGPALDRSVQHDLDATRRGLSLPDGLELTWLGTAGFRLAYAGTTLLVDPYVTRRGLRATVQARRLLGDAALVDRFLPGADAVLLGHTHFDHAVDTALLAARGARVYGSRSARRLLALHGLEANAVAVAPRTAYEIGPFTVRFVPSLHSKLLLGLAVPQGGDLTCDALDHLGMGAYRCGQTWGIHIEVAGTTLYHQGSANLIEDEYDLGAVDVFLCGIAGRIYTDRFVPRALRMLRPAVVVPHHYDDFFRPVDAEMGYSFNVNLAGFVDDVAAVDPDVPVRTLEPLCEIRG
jgi:L-ascorbate metabolism protein UlaG (beta-lactamase superfamily)